MPTQSTAGPSRGSEGGSTRRTLSSSFEPESERISQISSHRSTASAEVVRFDWTEDNEDAFYHALEQQLAKGSRKTYNWSEFRRDYKKHKEDSGCGDSRHANESQVKNHYKNITLRDTERLRVLENRYYQQSGEFAPWQKDDKRRDRKRKPADLTNDPDYEFAKPRYPKRLRKT